METTGSPGLRCPSEAAPGADGVNPLLRAPRGRTRMGCLLSRKTDLGSLFLRVFQNPQEQRWSCRGAEGSGRRGPDSHERHGGSRQCPQRMPDPSREEVIPAQPGPGQCLSRQTSEGGSAGNGLARTRLCPAGAFLDGLARRPFAKLAGRDGGREGHRHPSERRCSLPRT